MYHRAIIRVILAYSIFGPGFLSADPVLDVRGDSTVNDWSRYASFQIAIERNRYSPGEDVAVRFRIQNTGYRIFRMFPSLEPGRSCQFLLTDRAGREIPLRFNPESYRNRENGDRDMRDLNGDPVKEIILHPGESYEKIVYLNDFYQLSPGIEYRIAGYYYPDARYNFFVRSANTAQIRIDRNRDAMYRNRRDEELSVDTGISVSPEETVFLFLSAEIQQNWTNYLKYLDLRKYIRSYDRFAARFARAGDAEKPAILRDFTSYLIGQPSDRLRRFRIVSTDHERNREGEILERGRAYVTVQAERETRGTRVRYEYIYTLEPGRETAEGFWKIIDVTARVVR